MTLETQKEAFRDLLTQNQIAFALDMLHSHIDSLQDQNLQKEIVLFSSQFKELQQKKRTRTASPENLAREQNTLIFSLYDLIPLLSDPMPEEAWNASMQKLNVRYANQNSTDEKDLSPKQIQQRLLIALGIAKFIILGFAFTFQESGGLLEQHFYSLLGLFFPSLLVFVGMTMRTAPSFLQGTKLPSLRSNYLLLLGYAFIACFIIYLNLDFMLLILLLLLLESIVNMYWGRLFRF